jgi:hypothetical protein
VVVERDADAIAEEAIGAVVLFRVEWVDEGRDPADLRFEVER